MLNENDLKLNYEKFKQITECNTNKSEALKLIDAIFELSILVFKAYSSNK